MTDAWISISITFLAGYTLLMFYYWSGWMRTRQFSSKGKAPQTKVSVIIAARNEESNIERCITAILMQDYPRELFEIIIVDDFSDDRTHERVRQLISHNKGVNLRIIPSNFPGKKRAIETGIENSTGQLIVTSDADCVAGDKWITTIIAYYEMFHPKMIAAPVAFIDEKTWIEKWQSLDLCGMMAITAGAITNGFPNMCNGANLAYQKRAFEEIGGFSGIDQLPSGDDVMLMQKLSKRYPGSVHFLKSHEASVLTQTEKKWSSLFKQRLRWLSKGTAFPDWRVSAVLLFSYVFNLTIVISFIAGIFFRELLIFSVASFFIKTLAELPLLWSGCNYFQKGKLMLHILPAQLLHVLYVVVGGGVSRFSGVSWKGRKY